MDILRTPDERFADLDGWSFEPRYLEVSAEGGPSLRMHFVDEGPADAAPVLLLHGEPSWAYLYRTMIPPLVERGHRVIVPDLIGFGRSDKPADRHFYTYARHVGWVGDLVEQLDLNDVTFFGQDWGGLIGLRVIAEKPDRFAAVVVGNTGLPTGEQDLGEGFEAWKKFSQETPEFPVGNIVNGGSNGKLSPAAIAAYDAPFPSEEYKAGARQFPTLVPASTDDPAAPAQQAAWEVLSKWEKPFVTAFSDGDPITRGGDKPFQELIPGASGQAHRTIEGPAHFLQEEAGPELAGIVHAAAAAALSKS